MILLGGGPNRLNAAAHPPKSWAQLVFLGDYGANLRRPSSDAVGCAVRALVALPGAENLLHCSMSMCLHSFCSNWIIYITFFLINNSLSDMLTIWQNLYKIHISYHKSPHVYRPWCTQELYSSISRAPRCVRGARTNPIFVCILWSRLLRTSDVSELHARCPSCCVPTHARRPHGANRALGAPRRWLGH